MDVSTLFLSILRGKWLIDPRQVDAHLLLLEQLLTHQADIDRMKLSDREAMTHRCSTESGAVVTEAFDDAPAGSTAIIPIRGTMTKYGNWCSYGTLEIANLMMEAVLSDKIDSIVLDIDSGGGEVNAVAPLLDAIAECKRKNKGCVASVDLCASAAYWVACQTDAIIPVNAVSSELGSIGVMMSFADYAKYYEQKGIKMHTIYSNLSDYKNAPYEAALKGEYDKIKNEELDPLARKFQDAVRQHRQCLDMEAKGLLNGRVYYADEAVKKGLADRIGSLEEAIGLAKQFTASYMLEDYMLNK